MSLSRTLKGGARATSGVLQRSRRGPAEKWTRIRDEQPRGAEAFSRFFWALQRRAPLAHVRVEADICGAGPRGLLLTRSGRPSSRCTRAARYRIASAVVQDASGAYGFTPGIYSLVPLRRLVYKFLAGRCAMPPSCSCEAGFSTFFLCADV